MKTSYWETILERRLSRRRALVGSSAAASAAAFLAACGGGEDGDSGGGGTGGGASSLVTKSQDTSKQAKTGGTLKEYANSEPAHLDAQQPLASLNFEARNVYGTLLREEAGYLEPKKGKIVGDAAESWEFSPDHLTLTLKLRQGVKFHNLPPVNGRTMDIDDIKFNFTRYTASGALRSLMFNSVNPDAPVTSVAFPDS